MKRIAILTLALVLALGVAGAAAAPARPYVLVDSFEALHAQPGQHFDLVVTLANVGAREARDMTVSLEPDAGSSAQSTLPGSAGAAETAAPFLTVDSGSIRFVDKLAAEDTATVTFRLVAPGDTAPGVYALPLTLSYGDSGSRTYAMAQTLGIVVSQPDALAVFATEVPARMEMGEQRDILIDIANIGNAPLKGIRASLSGPLSADMPLQFFGNFEPGDADGFAATLTAEAAGDAPMTLTVTYIDAFGASRETVQTFTVEVPQPETQSQDQVEESKGFFAAIGDFFKFLFGIKD